jgi:hypothetical protein
MRVIPYALGAIALGLALVAGSHADTPQKAARFDAAGKMQFPAEYRTWVFLSSGHGMSYNPRANAAAEAPFDNVFVDPASYRAFLQTGTWPDGTVLALEVRAGTSHGSINQAGAYQSGEPLGVEVHTKDTARFGGDGWAFFPFEGKEPSTMIPKEAACYACHAANTAVDRTFVQFYPTLLPVARAKGTLTAAYLAQEKVEPAKHD